MTDGDDVFAFDEYLRSSQRDRMIEQARSDKEKAKWMQEMVLKCHICQAVKGAHNLKEGWDGHPWCKDNLSYLAWKFKKKGNQ